MSGLLARFRSEERGQSLVEFAVSVPLLLLLLLGIMDFARAWNIHQVLTDAGREATRVAVVDNGSTDPQIRQIARDAAARAGITLPDGQITITQGAGRGDPTTVRIQYGHELRWVGWALSLVGADRTLNLNVVSTMRRE
ncbi:MAG: TadE/TadG family type IV pilus assembly protein [Longimicrobiales bacterium]|nr:TadE/TadG family type IV pilus assembly protein [Longimicrobiales bacterium]